MSTQFPTATDTEAERQERLTELVGEHGPKWLEGYKPGSFGCHELLDRTSFVAATVEHLLASHPACVQNREWYALADQAVTALWELYQRIGTEHLGENGTSQG